MEYPSILKPKTLKEVVEKIPKIGVPTRFSGEYLRTLGYKSSNDRPVISILKFIGFIDSSETPTEKYKSYRGKDGKVVLARAIKSGYLELFNLYPDAHRKDVESLNHFFATKTSAGERSLQAMVQTFRTLCSLAEFESVDGEQEQAEEAEKFPRIMGKSDRTNSGTTVLPININIELQIPATNDADVYEKFFTALKKHLLS